MFSVKESLLLLLFMVLISAIQGMNKCKTETQFVNPGDHVILKSQGYGKKNPPTLPCKEKKYAYKSISGTKLSFSCSGLQIKNKKKDYLWNSANKKKCTKKPCKATSTSNNLTVKYVTADKKKQRKKFAFKCKVESMHKSLDTSICDECGIRYYSSGVVGLTDTKIVGGEDAAVKEFPYQVLIIITKGFNQFQCGGTLVTSRWVVTAAHCEAAANDVVTLGLLNQVSPESHSKEVTVEVGIPHPKYNAQSSDRYDIAVLKLREKVTFNDYIQPACLPDPFTNENFLGEMMDATGWGTTAYLGFTSDVLQKVTLEVISNSQCESSGPTYSGNVFVDNICTYTVGKDACQGDSGGPLARHTNDVSFLIGVTSYGYGCAFTDKPGVFTKVSEPNMLKWVKKTIGIGCDVQDP